MRLLAARPGWGTGSEPRSRIRTRFGGGATESCTGDTTPRPEEVQPFNVKISDGKGTRSCSVRSSIRSPVTGQSRRGPSTWPRPREAKMSRPSGRSRRRRRYITSSMVLRRTVAWAPTTRPTTSRPTTAPGCARSTATTSASAGLSVALPHPVARTVPCRVTTPRRARRADSRAAASCSSTGRRTQSSSSATCGAGASGATSSRRGIPRPASCARRSPSRGQCTGATGAATCCRSCLSSGPIREKSSSGITTVGGRSTAAPPDAQARSLTDA
jgi:hypothetical protein